jgi:hypothetical protein
MRLVFKAKKSLSATNQVELSMPNVKDLLFTNNKKVTHIADENYNVQTLFGWFFIGYFYGFSSLLNAIYY